jgi:hypothetical protein
MNTSAFGVEKGTLIRVPATANLMIDSDDRAFQQSDILDTSPWRFQISRAQALIQGFFTRVGLTELVLNWDIPNISSQWNNNLLFVDVSGSDISGAKTITLPDGFYTAKKAIDCIVEELNTEYATPSLFSVIQDCNGVGIEISGNRVWTTLMSVPLANQLFQYPSNIVNDLLPNAKTHYLPSPDLRTIKYLDFIADSITSVQDVEDSTTVPYVKNVLQRWYMAWDDQNDLDAYGLPIYQGYTPFSSRKVFNPPKQIKYESSIPVGNLTIDVWARFSPAFYAVAPLTAGYGSLANLYTPPDSSSFLMTLQLSEG